MIKGIPLSKWQRVWLQIRPTFDTSICTELKGLISKWSLCCRLLVLPGAGPGSFVRKTSSLQDSGRRIHHFPGGLLANFYGNLYNLNVIFKGMEVRTPLPAFGSAHASALKLSSHTYVFFSLCLTTYYGCIKSARNQSRDIWRLELGKVKNTTFLVKRKFLFLRTI